MLKKILTTILLGAIIFFNLNSIAHASDFKFSASADKEELYPGDEVSITMSISDIDVDRGINVIEAYLYYDENIFENVEMQNTNDWEITYNTETGERYGKFLILKMTEGQTEDEDVGKIKFKVKDNIPSQETEIKISEITSNDGIELIDEGERIIRFKIKTNNEDTPSDEEDDNEFPNQDDNNTDLNQNDKDASNANDDSNNNDNNTGNNILETVITSIKTGDTKVIVSIIILITVIIINIIVFIIRKKKNNKNTQA